MWNRFDIYAGLYLLLAGPLLTGCGTSEAVENSQVLAQRRQFLLHDEPQGAMAIGEARQTVQEHGGRLVVVVGRISAGEHSPWDDGRSAFLLSDPSFFVEETDDDHHRHDEGHDHANCPFCNAKAGKTAMAIVQCLDSSGQVLDIDTRQLLGIEENQLVVVQGQAEVDDVENLVISADGIYVRQ